MLLLGSNGSSKKQKCKNIFVMKNSIEKTKERNFNLGFEINSAFEVFW